jgi:CubicO group peptidase (beta-lactamase class C family)
MRPNHSFLFFIALLVVSSGSVLADDVDDFVKAQMQLRHIPAVSIAVVKDGVLVKTAAYGMADIENNVPARAETVYKIGSLSKQFK